MGGKRPDQYAIDPGEAGSTDYKFRREDEGIKEIEKHELNDHRSTPGKQRPHIPEHHDNPALADLKARKRREGQEE